MKAAGIDIGSNNIRMIAGRVENGKILEVLADESGITRLGAGIAQTGELSEQSMTKTLALLEKFAIILEKLTIKRIKAAATSAVREASNSDMFITKARALGIPLETVTGEEEARYVALGVLSGMENSKGNYIIYDIGGGSTEFSLVIQGGVVSVATVPLGVVKLYDLFGFQNAVGRETLDECARYADDLLKNTMDKLKTLIPPNCRLTAVGTSGSVTTAAAMDMALTAYDPIRVSKYILTLEKVQKLMEDNAALSAPERLKFPGLQKGREDLVLGGFIAIKAILNSFGLNESAVSDHGLREGLLISAVY